MVLCPLFIGIGKGLVQALGSDPLLFAESFQHPGRFSDRFVPSRYVVTRLLAPPRLIVNRLFVLQVLPQGVQQIEEVS